MASGNHKVEIEAVSDRFGLSEHGDPLHISLESDGTSAGTSVVCNGKPIPNVTGIEWRITAGFISELVLKFEASAIRLSGQFEKQS